MLSSQIDILASLISGYVTHTLARYYIDKLGISWQLRLPVPGMKSLKFLLKPARLTAVEVKLAVEPPAGDQIGLIVAKLHHTAAAEQHQRNYKRQLAEATRK